MNYPNSNMQNNGYMNQTMVKPTPQNGFNSNQQPNSQNMGMPNNCNNNFNQSMTMSNSMMQNMPMGNSTMNMAPPMAMSQGNIQ